MVGIPRTRGLLYSPCQPLGIPFAITPLGQLSALTHPRGPRKRSQSPVKMLERSDTYGQVQICTKGHQGSSNCPIDRPCQPSPSFCLIKFWHVRSPLPQSIRLNLNVIVRYWAGQGDQVYPRRPQMKEKRTSAPITPI